MSKAGCKTARVVPLVLMKAVSRKGLQSTVASPDAKIPQTKQIFKNNSFKPMLKSKIQKSESGDRKGLLDVMNHLGDLQKRHLFNRTER